MSSKYSRQAPASTGLILIFLGLITLIGLMLGILTHALVSRSTLAQTGQTTPRVGAVSTSTSTAGSGPTSTTTAGASAFNGRFLLTISVTPKNVQPGQQLTITVHAYTADTHAPISGLPCILRAPIDGSASLLATFPAAQTTDDNGAASWIVTTPNAAAGAYEVEAFAQTHSWSFKADSSVNVG